MHICKSQHSFLFCFILFYFCVCKGRKWALFKDLKWNNRISIHQLSNQVRYMENFFKLSVLFYILMAKIKNKPMPIYPKENATA